MCNKKLSFLIFLSFLSFTLQSAEDFKGEKIIGHKLSPSSFDLKVEKRISRHLSAHKISIKRRFFWIWKQYSL
jgi:hypothetical protein